MLNNQHSPHWIDKLATQILKWQEKNDVKKLHVDDMKTPSGRVHTGALKGVLLHDMVAKALSEKVEGVVSTYVFNNTDPMDGLPNYLEKNEYEKHMGKPMHLIPAPSLEKCGIDLSKASEEELADFKNAESFGHFYAYDFIHAFRKLGCEQKIVWSSDLYKSGKMDAQIKTALDNVVTFRKIYQEVADYNLPKDWHPFQIICPQCGKIGTTLVTGWNGEQVTYECKENQVEWAKGCGHKGQISPFGGNGKLLWKVDWPALWKTLGINIEGAGKDHTSAGGSRDMANAMCAQIFKIQKPFDIPYEWILIRGAKMSSSKGVGTSAREFTNLFPPEIGRFLFANKHYNTVIDFDPTTDSIPDLFDEYDLGARIFWGQEKGDERLGRAFELSQIGQVPQAHFLPRFRDLAIWMQHPEINLLEKFTKIKGSELTKQEQQILEERKAYAQNWLDNYANEEYQLRARAELPAAAAKLTSEQKEFLAKANELVDSKTWEPQALQQSLFELAKDSLSAKAGFQAIYLAFLGKTHGPRAAWFLLETDKNLRKQRVAQIQQIGKAETKDKFIYPVLSDDQFISIEQGVIDKYPGFMIGAALIRGVKINSTPTELQIEMQATFNKYRGMSNEAIVSLPKVASYRRAIKESGVNVGVRRPTMEALMRRLAKGNEIPSINNIVDIGNYMSVKHEMSSGFFDFTKINFPIVFKESVGGEQVATFGDKEPITLQPGEICYFDNQGPFAIDLCWRDAIRTSITEETTDVLVCTEVVYDVSRQDVEKFLQDSVNYLTKYCGGKLEKIGIIK